MDVTQNFTPHSVYKVHGMPGTATLVNKDDLFKDKPFIRINPGPAKLDLMKDYTFEEWKVVQENIIEQFSYSLSPNISDDEKEILLNFITPKPATQENYKDFLIRQYSARRRENAPAPAALAAQFAEMRMKQDARPVELAIYQGDKMVAFKSSGFTSMNGIESALPEDWGTMPTEELKKALQSRLQSKGYTVVTTQNGLSMNHGQAMEIFNQR